MEEPNSPYVWRDEPAETGDDLAPDGEETVIVDGEVVSYRAYQRGTRPDLDDY
jgi:hypothetical protein